MSESAAHKKAKAKAAGKIGKTEVAISKNRRLDAATKTKATEVERSGSAAGLAKAAQRLKDSRKPHKVLQVPQNDMRKAIETMKENNVSGTVKNMGGTKRFSVSKRGKK